jgi:HlyD family secretion protein
MNTDIHINPHINPHSPSGTLRTGRKRAVLLAALAVLATVAALTWAFAPRPVEVETGSAVRERFELAIEEDGRTRLRHRFTVSAPVSGRLSRIALREGDAVQVGDALTELTPAPPSLLDERALRSQQARVEAAQAGLQRAGARVARTRVAVEQARSDLRRTEQLAAKGFIAATRLEQERLSEQAALRELEASVAEQDVSLHELEQARYALTSARDMRPGSPSATGTPLPVRSPTSGRVLRLLQTSEGNVTAGAPLLEIGDITQLEIVAELLTTQALRAHVGDRVLISGWGGPGPLEGRLQSIEPAAFTKISALGVEEQRVNAIIKIVSPPVVWQALGDGYRVSVRILTDVLEDALCVPVSAVFPLPGQHANRGTSTEVPADRPMAVFVLTEGRARLQPVRLNARNGQQAHLGDGLKAGESVVVYPPPTLRDGMRVSLRGG